MHDPEFANETKGVNLFPFASMAGGWLGPLAMFWLYVWGPLRPFDYPAGDLSPRLSTFILLAGLSIAMWWLPEAYYRVRPVEQSGRLYEALGVRLFRAFVPDGDLSNRWRRRREPRFRIVRNRRMAEAFAWRTRESERAHLVLLMMGILSTAFAWQIGWHGWAAYLGIGNVLVNLYPVLLQRYTRSRIARLVAGRATTEMAPGT
jgi:hypothetical protein